MARRKTLSDIGVANLKPRAGRYAEPDPELKGHYVRVSPSGTKVYTIAARDPAGKQVWATVGSTELFGIEEAREKARGAIRRVMEGLPAIEPPIAKLQSFQDVADAYLKRHVEAKGLRSGHEVKRLLKQHVFPIWQDREFISLRRSDITALLDHIQDNSGARQADYVLAIVRGICNWYAARHDDYLPPIVRGMRRTESFSRKRDRILSDDEIRLVWKASQSCGPFGALVRLSLLSAQRRDKVATMKWSDLVGSEWRIPSEVREKGNAGVLVLPDLALAEIASMPRFEGNPFVFAGRGIAHLSGYSKSKAALDKLMPDMPHWVLHDLRRTARSLMARSGVRPDVAERVMGHAIPGVEGVYDRHTYKTEKAEALQKLSVLLTDILHEGDDDA